jgi:hypothetical protein
MFQKKFVEKTKTHILCPKCFSRKSCRLWNNMEKCCRGRQATVDNKIWRMGITSWIHNTTNTHSEYVIHVVFLLQQWLHERAPVLRHTYIFCIVIGSCGFKVYGRNVKLHEMLYLSIYTSIFVYFNGELR